MTSAAARLQEQSATTAHAPKGWAWARVEDILVPGSPVVYGILQPGPDTPGGIPYIRPTEIDGDVIQVQQLRRTVLAIAAKYKRSEVRADDVILTIVGTIGKVAIVPDGLDGANITQSSCRLRADGRALCSRYLAWTMRSPALRGQFDKLRLGTAVPRLNIAHVRYLLVPIAPLPEQRRIVAKIEELFSDLDAGVAALERVRANLKRYRAAVLKAAVEGRLTEEWRKQHPPPHTEPAAKLLERILAERRAKWEQDQLRKFKEAGKTPPKGWREKYEEVAEVTPAGLSSLPQTWCRAAIRNIGHVQLGRQRAPQHHSGTHMRPYLRVANVFENRIDTSDVMEMNFTPDEFETYRLKPKDILLNEGQSMELVGRPAMYRGEVPGACFTNTLVRFQACPAVLPDFALLVFLAYLKNGRFQRIATITVNIAHLGAGRFAELEFPLPPLAEQAEIVAEVDRRLSVADAAEMQVEHALQRAARLRQSILKRAFEGKLVEQDPTDEPAAALVERIKMSRCAASVAARAVVRNKNNCSATPTKRRSRAHA